MIDQRCVLVELVAGHAAEAIGTMFARLGATCLASPYFRDRSIEAAIQIPDVPKLLAVPDLLPLYTGPAIEALAERMLTDLANAVGDHTLVTYRQFGHERPNADVVHEGIRIQALVTETDGISATITISVAYEVVPV